MDNHGEWSPQTFLVNNVSFLQPPGGGGYSLKARIGVCREGS